MQQFVGAQMAFQQNIDRAFARHAHRNFGSAAGSGNKLGPVQKFREAECLSVGAN